eukprot:2737643-Alexandrium_andersonii.AAC.1
MCLYSSPNSYGLSMRNRADAARSQALSWSAGHANGICYITGLADPARRVSGRFAALAFDGGAASVRFEASSLLR